MPGPTASRSASINFLTEASTGNAPSIDARPSVDAPLDNYLGAQARALYVAGMVAPWLGNVQRRLNASIGIAGAPNDGSSLPKDVVLAANSFFEATSYMLPNEPHMYASHSGDLVAEFESNAGRMTLIVSKDQAVALAVVGNEMIQKNISLTATAPAALQDQLSTITDRLRIRLHGSMDPQR